MQKQQGFTLIELVVVIIILGILAVVAAPKFLNLQGDAKVSTLQGMKAALQGANSMIYSKAVISGQEKVNGDSTNNIDTDGNGTADLIAVYGYVKADATELAKVLEIDANDWNIEAPASGVSTTSTIIIYRSDSTTPTTEASTQCFLGYASAASVGAQPSYEIVTTGC